LATVGAVARQFHVGTRDLKACRLTSCGSGGDKRSAVHLDHPATLQAHQVGMIALAMQFVMVALLLQVQLADQALLLEQV